MSAQYPGRLDEFQAMYGTTVDDLEIDYLTRTCRCIVDSARQNPRNVDYGNDFDIDAIIDEANLLSDLLLQSGDYRMADQSCKIYNQLNLLCERIWHYIEIELVDVAELRDILNRGFGRMLTEEPFVMSSFWRTDATDGAPSLPIGVNYPGSSVLMAMIYDRAKNIAACSGDLTAMDVATPDLEPAKAVVNRSELIADKILDRFEKGESIDILELAGGVGKGSYELIKAAKVKGVNVDSVSLLDTDVTQKDVATAMINEVFEGDSSDMNLVYDVEEGNVVKFNNVAKAASEKRPSVVLAIGICDYFDRAQKLWFFRKIISVAQPGAKIGIGIFKDDYPQMASVSIMMNWFLKTISAPDLHELAEEAGFVNVSVEVFADTQLMLVCETPKH